MHGFYFYETVSNHFPNDVIIIHFKCSEPLVWSLCYSWQQLFLIKNLLCCMLYLISINCVVNQQYMYSIWKFNTLDCCHQSDVWHEEQLAEAPAQSNAKNQKQLTEALTQSNAKHQMMLHLKELFAQFSQLMHSSQPSQVLKMLHLI